MTGKIATGVSMVIPVYNEEGLVQAALGRCLAAMDRQLADFQIIVVDDGSTDGSYAAAVAVADGDHRVTVIKNQVNLNVGVAIQRGMSLASKEFVLHNAIDLPLDPETLPTLLSVASDADVLVVERTRYPQATVWRRITSLGNRLLLKLLFPFALRGIKDLNFVQLYRRSVLPTLMPLAKSPSFTTPEMILRARYKGLRVKTISADYQGRQKGKGAFGRPHDILWSLYDMLRFRIRSWRFRGQE